MGNTNTVEKGMEHAEKTHVLGLRDRKLTKLPPKLLKHEAFLTLRSMDVSRNRLKVISPHIARFTQLKRLNVSNNALKAFPWTCLDAMPLLQVVNLDNNQLTTLPTSLAALVKLTTFSCTQNKCAGELFTIFPKKTTTVDISSNQLTGVTAACLASLVGCIELRLSRNALQTFPATQPPALKKLEALYLDDNQLSAIPEELLVDTPVNNLHLAGNAITKKALTEMKGFDQFDARRRKQLNKQIHGGMNDTDRSICGLD